MSSYHYIKTMRYFMALENSAADTSDRACWTFSFVAASIALSKGQVPTDLTSFLTATVRTLLGLCGHRAFIRLGRARYA